MRILLTNDDGIASDGLWAAARGLARVGHLTVIGTKDDWSGGSASIRLGMNCTLHRFLDVPSGLGENVEAYAVGAAPGGAILAGLMSGLFEPFDLVASGSNYGINVGSDLAYSGTVGAAVVGFQRGISAFAISADRGAPRGEEQRWNGVSDVAERVARWLATRSGDPVLLNVNVPNRPFPEMQGAAFVPPAAWGNLDRAFLRATPTEEGGWYLSAAIDRKQGYPTDPDFDAGTVMAGKIAVTQVVPTGWPAQPPLNDVDDLLAALS